MTNKEFRRRAWALCRENFRLILGATFLASLISSLGMSLATSINASAVSLLIGVALTIVSIIMSIGMVRFILDIWHGEKPALSVLFSQKHRFFAYIGFMILFSLMLSGVMLGVMLVGTILYTDAALIVCALISLIAVLWLAIRFEMTAVCIVLFPNFRTTQCMRIAWRASKGNVWRLLCNTFVLGLPLFAAQGLLFGYSVYLSLTGQMLNAVGSLLLDFGSILISALLNGYIYLGSFSLHEYLLQQYFAAQPGYFAAEPGEVSANEESPLLLEDEYEDVPEEEEKTEE